MWVFLVCVAFWFMFPMQTLKFTGIMCVGLLFTFLIRR